MARSTREFTTSGGHAVVVYDYITGREQRAIQDVFLKKMEVGRITQTDGKADAGLSGFNASAVTEAQDVTFSTLVVSIDGTSDDIVQRILDLPAVETDEIVAVLNEITDSKKK